MDKKLLDYFGGDELAAGVWKKKYALENETTPDDMHRRMAKEFARIEESYQLFEVITHNLSEYGKVRKPLTEDSIYELFKDFSAVIPQGSIMAQLGAPSLGSLSNCFVVGQPYDSYGGIMQKDQQLVQLMKRRGGVGIDLSTLRPSGTATTNAAKSSTGAVSFMERFSNTTREVAQNGRRGALMISMDVRHPDIAEFATIKNDETKVTGANISVFLRDDFMKAVEEGKDYILRFPCEAELSVDKYDEWYPGWDDGGLHYIPKDDVQVKVVNASELYDKIIHSAWFRAEPGQLFLDRFHNYSPDGVYEEYRGVTTNPCSEIFMQPYDACRLIAINLLYFVENPFTEGAFFNYDKFYRVAYETQRLMDDLVDLEIEHIDRIIDKISNDPEPEEVKKTEIDLWKNIRRVASSGRRTGTGITALGDTVAALGIKYDSDMGLGVIEDIFATKMKAELECTIDLAVLRGPFKGFNANNEFAISQGGTLEYGKNELYQFLLDEFPEQAYKMARHGRRNVSWSTVAPTGTVSLMTQTTSGLEPLFMAFYTRRVKVNPNDPDMRVDFVDKMGDKWMELPVLHPQFKKWIEVNYIDIVDDMPTDVAKLSPERVQQLFEESPWFGSTANDINWVRRVEIQGIIQKYITHSISSTINLPNNVTEEEVRKIYLASWKEGLKGVTVYRDGCRSGVLVSDTAEPKEFIQRDAVKRPKKLPAETHVTVCKGDSFNVIVGLMDGKPYEVFMDNSDNRYSANGYLVKKAKGKYWFENGGDPVDIKSFMTDEQEAITRLVSSNLRHGVDIKFIVEQLQKTDGDMFGFTKGMARVLKKYIPDGVKSTATCKDCGSDNVIFEEGCSKCIDCGSSKCG
jgi:ribonucleoside-diphosphate reductase alpha chain